MLRLLLMTWLLGSAADPHRCAAVPPELTPDFPQLGPISAPGDELISKGEQLMADGMDKEAAVVFGRALKEHSDTPLALELQIRIIRVIARGDAKKAWKHVEALPAMLRSPRATAEAIKDAEQTVAALAGLSASCLCKCCNAKDDVAPADMRRYLQVFPTGRRARAFRFFEGEERRNQKLSPKNRLAELAALEALVIEERATTASGWLGHAAADLRALKE